MLYEQALNDLSAMRSREATLASDPYAATYVTQFAQSFGLPKNDVTGFVDASDAEKNLYAVHFGELKRALINAGPDDYGKIQEAYSDSYSKKKKYLTASTAAKTPASVYKQLERFGRTQGQEGMTVNQAASHARASGFTVEMLLAAEKEDPTAFKNKALFVQLIKVMQL